MCFLIVGPVNSNATILWENMFPTSYSPERHFSSILVCWELSLSQKHISFPAQILFHIYTQIYRKCWSCLFSEEGGSRNKSLCTSQIYCDFYSLRCTTVSHLISLKLIISQWFTTLYAIVLWVQTAIIQLMPTYSCTWTHHHGLSLLPVEKASPQMQFIPFQSKICPPRVSTSDIGAEVAEVLEVCKNSFLLLWGDIVFSLVYNSTCNKYW